MWTLQETFAPGFVARHRVVFSLIATVVMLQGCKYTSDTVRYEVEIQQSPTDVIAGQTAQFKARLLANGDDIGEEGIVWVMRDVTPYASINPTSGLLTAATTMDVSSVVLTVFATARDGQAEGAEATITVRTRVQQATLTPSSLALTVGGQFQFIPTITIAPGSPTTPVPVVTWLSNSSTVSVDGSGRITANTATPAGTTALITAKSEGTTSNQVAVTVTSGAGSVPTSMSIVVTSTPATGSVAVGATRQHAIQVRDQAGTIMGGLTTATWSIVGTAGIATINATSGLASCVGAGTVTVHAVGPLNGAGVALTADASLQCVAASGLPAVSVVFTPPSVTVAVGATTQTVASYRDSNGQVTTNGCPLVFAIDASAVASLTANGMTVNVTGVGVGTSTLRAFCQANGLLMGTAPVQVTAQ